MKAVKLTRRASSASVALLAILSVLPTPAGAQDEASFYKGKTVRFVVGTSPGGGYDIYARALAPHLEKKLGTTVIVENRPGGSHMVAMNYVYSLAAPDGLTFMIAPGEGAVLGKLLAEPGVRFDLNNYPILGRVNTAPRILLLNPKLPYRSINDIRTAGKPLTLGFAGKTDGASDTAVVLCHALKIACRAIIGYPSSQEFTLAAVRGEVDGTVLVEDSALRFSQNGQLRPIVVTGGERSSMAPHIPTIMEATEIDAEGRWWLEFREDLRKLGRLIVTSPGVPPARLKFLQEAVQAIATDPQILADFEAKGMPLRYGPPDEMAKIIKSLLGGSISDTKVSEIRHVISEKFYQ
jgi:tripartite-type tricarboxylate transporter receptor subunit TctC